MVLTGSWGLVRKCTSQSLYTSHQGARTYRHRCTGSLSPSRSCGLYSAHNKKSGFHWLSIKHIGCLISLHPLHKPVQWGQVQMGHLRCNYNIIISVVTVYSEPTHTIPPHPHSTPGRRLPYLVSFCTLGTWGSGRWSPLSRPEASNRERED